MYRMRSHNCSSRRDDCRGGVPGFIENLYLYIYPGVSARKLDCEPLSGEFCDQIHTQRSEYFASLAVYIS